MNPRKEETTMSGLKNYYEILEVDYNATQEQIYEGYVRAKNTYSGDGLALYSMMTKDECQEMLDMIEAAYSVLSIPYKRKEYDQIKGLGQAARIQESYSLSPSSINPLSSSENADAYRNTGEQLSFRPSSKHPSQQSQQPQQNKEREMPARPGPMDFQRDFQINRKEADVSRLSAQKRFGLAYSTDESFESEISSTTLFTGSFLKKIREYKNVSIERMSDLTKISRSYLKSIEDEELSKLPALTYVRGFVYQYAKCLRLNPDFVSTSYIKHLKSAQGNGKGSN